MKSKNQIHLRRSAVPAAAGSMEKHSNTFEHRSEPRSAAAETAALQSSGETAVENPERCSRRRFITRSVLASTAFMVLPHHVLGRGGAKSPNEKLNIAGIGIGGQGGHDIGQMLSENIVALCD